MLLMAAGAQAQTWTKLTDSGDIRSDASVITSGSTLTALPVKDIGRNMHIVLSSTTPVSVSIARRLANGTTLSTQTLAVDTSTVSVTIASPLYFQGLLISNTTGLSGVNALHTNVLQVE